MKTELKYHRVDVLRERVNALYSREAVETAPEEKIVSLVPREAAEAAPAGKVVRLVASAAVATAPWRRAVETDPQGSQRRAVETATLSDNTRVALLLAKPKSAPGAQRLAHWRDRSSSRDQRRRR